MLITGLVSLNIHEPLTFDGTEIVLHPDLFCSNADGAVGSSSFSTTVVAGSTSNRLSVGVGGTSSANNSNALNKDSRISLVPTGSSEDKLSTVAPSLQAGDMIEIRVWDPLPRSPETNRCVSSVMRRPPLPQSAQQQQQQQHPLSGQSSSCSASVSNTGPIANQAANLSATVTLQEAASNLARNRTQSTTTSHSMQYSESTIIPHALTKAASVESGVMMLDEAFATTKEGDESTVSSVDRSHSVVTNSEEQAAGANGNATTPAPSPKSTSSLEHVVPTKATTGELPPVFPRNLAANTNDVAVPATLTTTATTTTCSTSLPPKPPVSFSNPRRNPPASPMVATPVAAIAAAADPNTAISAPSISKASLTRTTPPSAAMLRPRHFRDLSDMTIDTLYDSSNNKTTLLDGSHQLVDLNVQLPPNNNCGPPAMAATAGTHALSSTTADDEEETISHLSATHTERLSFVMQVGEATLTSLKGSARTQVSLLRPVAELYNLSQYDMVTIRKIEKQDEEECLKSCCADFVLVTIKDQFISRGEMHSFLQDTLVGSWVYEGQRLFEASRNIQAHARQMRHKDVKVPSGFITEDTKITFRSRSARFVWLVQMSSEMWDYSSPYQRHQDESKCETYFDKWISFVRRLFDKWKEVEATHSLTIVFFSRTFVGESPPIWYPGHTTSKNRSPASKDRDIYGRQFEDHFRIVIENETVSDWENLIVRLKEAFVRYPIEVGWNLATGKGARRPSSASQGNVLEATNVTLNLLQFHYLDRDLHRTGNSIVIISAGNGVFEVDKGLASITYERMMVNGIGSDMLSLALPPLHTAPFFLYVNDRTSEEGGSVDFGGTYYEVPHWMHLSFVSYNSEERFVAVDMTHAPKKETPCLIEIDGRPLLANGFLLPNSVMDAGSCDSSGTSPLVRPTALPASPIKKTKIVSQERQLIAGRDFNDILEACRPRNSGNLPSALEAILRMCQPIKSNGSSVEGETKKNTDGIPDLPEWGSLEFDSGSDTPFRHRRVVALGQEPAVDLSPCFEPLPTSVLAVEDATDSDPAEKESVASSYASQLSSGLGVSYDRPFLATKASPTLTGIQVQKSPSLDIFLNDTEEDEAALSDRSDSSAEASFDSERAERKQKQSDKFIASIKKQMRNYDSKFLEIGTPIFSSLLPEQDFSRNGDGISLRLSSAGSVSQQHRPIQRTGAQPGGIGAALTHYRTTSGGAAPIREHAEGPPAVSRVASTTRLATMAPRVHVSDMGSRGMSPLLLPPVMLSTSEIPRTSARPRTIEQRLVHPSDYSRSGFESLSRVTAANATVSSLARSPPIAASPVLAMSMMSSSSIRQRSRPTRSSKTGPRSRSKSRSRRNKAFNPFRQQDEDEVLAKKSHNRRRWSHVFPFGEVEFKRHAGPNWNSLSSPAILPIFIDYFPSQQEVDHNFTFSYYNITLSEFENSPYSSNKDFLMEMVRQRLTQDYQLVPPSHVNASNYRRQALRHEAEGPGIMRQFLSMGHRLQVLTYDASADEIEVTLYDAKTTRQTTGANLFTYHYRCFCQETGRYHKVVQQFTKFAEPYNWNKVDRIICGDEERELREGMRFKRLMFAVIPDRFENESEEIQYVSKFQRLLEYLNKLRDKGESSDPLDIKVITSAERKRDPSIPIESTPGVERDGMQRFYVRLRKGKLDKLEWMEFAVDATFDTLWSYRIMFHWLVAGSAKVETQVQLLQRRCTQFGLTLVSIPQISVSKSLYLGPFQAPAIVAIRDKRKVARLDKELHDLDFLHDGVFFTDARMVVTECLDNGEEFDFGKRWSRPPVGRQFLHRSGTLFVRVLTDLNGLGLVVTFGNYLYMSKDPKLKVVAQKVFQQLSERMDALLSPDKVHP